MSMPAVFLRRARIRGLKEGLVQSARVESLENDAKDAAERFQDYGFAANLVEGQGLVITAGGHTVVLRADRLAERPQLPAYQVSVWHKEGHNVTLKDGKLIEVSCDTFKVNAAIKVEFNTPLVALSGHANIGGRMTSASATVAGKIIESHTHPDLTSGGNTGPNN